MEEMDSKLSNNSQHFRYKTTNLELIHTEKLVRLIRKKLTNIEQQIPAFGNKLNELGKDCKDVSGFWEKVVSEHQNTFLKVCGRGDVSFEEEEEVEDEKVGKRAVVSSNVRARKHRDVELPCWIADKYR